ncbi:MAG: 30S ribosome-binding factor RbfA [Clostridia bacterium]|nr:30S ribosome-binding factor RbfA [Clostridia bacterium]
MVNNRIGKVNAELQKNIYEILVTKVKDPRLTEMFTITQVSVDKELTVAKVFVSIFSTDPQKSKNTFEAIQNSTNFVRSNLFKMMRMRTIPQITFYLDEVGDYGQKIDEILDSLAKNRN